MADWVKKQFSQYGIYFVFAGLIILFSFISKVFLTSGNIINILQQTVALGIAAVGMSFVMISGGIDTSVGSVMYLASCAGAQILNKGFGIPAALTVVLLFGLLAGTVNGIVIAKYKVAPFIATLATTSIARGIGLVTSQAKMLFLGTASYIIAGTRWFGIPVTVYVLIAVVLLADFFLNRKSFGRQLLAIGADSLGAEKAGIFVKRRVFAAYLICSMLAGLAGFLSTAQISAIDPKFASGYEFTVISASVLGGTSLFGGKGNIFPGILMGALIVTIIENGLNIMNASPYIYPIVKGLIIFFAVMVDSMKSSGEMR